MTRAFELRHRGLAALGVLSLLAGPAVAADDGWYLGVGAGQSRAKIDDDRIRSGLAGSGLSTNSIDDDDRGVGLKVFGGYRFDRHFAVESGYYDLGRFGFDAATTPTGTLTGKTRMRGVNLDLVGTLPITDRFSLFGRAGVAYSQARDTFAGSGAVIVVDPSPRKRAANYKAGVGLEFALTDAIAVRAEAERYRVDDAIRNKGDVDLLSLGLVYRFGAKSPTPAPPAPVAVAAAPMPRPAAVPPSPPPPPPPPAPTRVTFAADALFDFDRSTIRRPGNASLDRFATDLKGTRYDRIVVTGHTDRLGPHDYNVRLSTSRAEAVKAWLVKTGIPGDRIETHGANGADPVTRPKTCVGSKPTAKLIACLQPDRRVVVEVTATP